MSQSKETLQDAAPFLLLFLIGLPYILIAMAYLLVAHLSSSWWLLILGGIGIIAIAALVYAMGVLLLFLMCYAMRRTWASCLAWMGMWCFTVYLWSGGMFTDKNDLYVAPDALVIVYITIALHAFVFLSPLLLSLLMAKGIFPPTRRAYLFCCLSAWGSMAALRLLMYQSFYGLLTLPLVILPLMLLRRNKRSLGTEEA